MGVRFADSSKAVEGRLDWIECRVFFFASTEWYSSSVVRLPCEVVAITVGGRGKGRGGEVR